MKQLQYISRLLRTTQVKGKTENASAFTSEDNNGVEKKKDQPHAELTAVGSLFEHYGEVLFDANDILERLK